MPLVERGMRQTKGHELNGDKASDDGKGVEMLV
jgi:hypothetical protein